MTGPDRRETRHSAGMVGGGDPDDSSMEDYVVTIIGARRGYHIRADVSDGFVADTPTTSRRFQVVAEVDANFKGSAEHDG